MHTSTLLGAASALVLLLIPATGFANTIVIHNTGNGSTTDGTVDPNWSFTTSVGGSAGQALVAGNPGVDFFNGNCCGGGPWTPNTATSAWIVDNTGNAQSGGNPLSFRTTFDLTGLNPLTASLSGAWGIDDGGDLLLNGHVISSLPGQNASHWDHADLNAFSVNGTSGDFVAGINILSVVFTDNDNAFEGVNVRVSGSADPVTDGQVPEPASLALLATGLAGFGWARRRKAA